MPPLHFLGRVWFISSDDFVFPGLFFGVISGTLAFFTAASLIHFNDNLTYCSSNVHPEGLDGRLQGALYVEGGLVTALALESFILSFFSFRGTIMDDSKRRSTVPLCCWVTCFTILAMVATMILIAIFAFGYEMLRPCYEVGASMRIRLTVLVCVQIVFTTFLFIFTLCGIFLLSSPRLEENSENTTGAENYGGSWRQKMSYALLRGSSNMHDTFTDVSQAFTNIFQGINLVPSDIVAGLVLLSGHQRRIMRQQKGVTVVVCDDERERNNQEEGQIVHNNDGYDTDFTHEREALISRKVTRVNSGLQQQIVISFELAADLDILIRFRKYFIAMYGWQLYIFMHPLTGWVRLLNHDPWFFRRDYTWRSPDGVAIDRATSNAMISVLGLPESSILMVSHRNELYYAPYLVARDVGTTKEGSAVVFAIRGSMSTDDLLTDLSIAPLHLRDLGERAGLPTGVEHFCHKGMLRCAHNILSDLEKAGLILELTNKDLANDKIVFVGHSLGAGIAILLSMIVKARYPDLFDRISCVAYSPPGATMSRMLAHYASTFTTSVFYNNDLVVRLSVDSVRALRHSLVNVLYASTEPKAVILGSCCCSDRTQLIDSEVADDPSATRKTETSCFKCDSAPEETARISTTLYESYDAVTGSTDVHPVAVARDALSFDGERETMLSSCRLYPPERLIWLHSASNPDMEGAEWAKRSFCCLPLFFSRLLCCCCRGGRNVDRKVSVRQASYVTLEDIQDIVVAANMFTDHFPNVLSEALLDTFNHALRAISVERMRGEAASNVEETVKKSGACNAGGNERLVDVLKEDAVFHHTNGSPIAILPSMKYPHPNDGDGRG